MCIYGLIRFVVSTHFLNVKMILRLFLSDDIRVNQCRSLEADRLQVPSANMRLSHH